MSSWDRFDNYAKKKGFKIIKKKILLQRVEADLSPKQMLEKRVEVPRMILEPYKGFRFKK